MNIPMTSPLFDDQPRAPTGSPNELMSETIGQGVAKIFDMHWADPSFMSELASDGFKGLTTMHLLNEMMNNWIDAEPETLEALTAKDCAAMELASWAWKPFFEYATTLEK